MASAWFNKILAPSSSQEDGHTIVLKDAIASTAAFSVEELYLKSAEGDQHSSSGSYQSVMRLSAQLVPKSSTQFYQLCHEHNSLAITEFTQEFINQSQQEAVDSSSSAATTTTAQFEQWRSQKVFNETHTGLLISKYGWYHNRATNVLTIVCMVVTGFEIWEFNATDNSTYLNRP